MRKVQFSHCSTNTLNNMNPLISLLIEAGLKYGPEFVSSLIKILNNPNATISDVEVAFANLKPYEAYNIPTKVD